MKLDLNEFLQEIHAWKNLTKSKDEEIEDLKRQLSFFQKQNEILELSHTSLFAEVGVLNSALSSLQDSFKKIEVFEADRRNFVEEKLKLKNSLEQLEKVYYEKTKKNSEELQKVKDDSKAETSKLLSQIKDEAFQQVEFLKKDLERKENEIEDLKVQITKLLSDRDQDLLKVKIQYEDRIGKLKQQIPKSRIQTPHVAQMHDIFRQKYVKLEKDSEEEISKLKKQIQSLQLLTESLKAKKGGASLSSVLLATSKPNLNATVEVSVQTESVFFELSRQFSNQDSDDTDDFAVKKKNFNKTQCVLPQKRKLFNLNKNYFVK